MGKYRWIDHSATDYRATLSTTCQKYMATIYSYSASLLKQAFSTTTKPSQHHLLFPAKSEIKEFLGDEERRNGENLTALYLNEIEKKENHNFNSKNYLHSW